MFTGIIEEKGKLAFIRERENLLILGIKASKTSSGTKIGDSVAVDGVCLTVIKRQRGVLVFEAMKETIDKTTLHLWEAGDEVNLERSLKVGGRFGGHFVSGHIDCVGTIKRIVSEKNNVRYDIKIPSAFEPFVVPKGSIAIDGMSLTVGEVKGDVLSIYIIPHTLEVTTLGHKNQFDKINVETDMIAKYILKNR